MPKRRPEDVPPGSPGRDPKPRDPKMIEELASIGCTVPEIASVLDCSTQHLYNHYHDNVIKGRNRGNETLRRAQWHHAMKGNSALLIWLGKNVLRQRDVPPEDLQFNGKLSQLLDAINKLEKQEKKKEKEKQNEWKKIGREKGTK